MFLNGSTPSSPEARSIGDPVDGSLGINSNRDVGYHTEIRVCHKFLPVKSYKVSLVQFDQNGIVVIKRKCLMHTHFSHLPQQLVGV
jgi:hypothetical protein